jgi:hypothetical protein
MTHAENLCLLLWGGQKVTLELVEWRSIDLHSINSTSSLGMMQASVGQKLVNRDIFMSFFVVRLRVVSRYF